MSLSREHIERFSIFLFLVAGVSILLPVVTGLPFDTGLLWVVMSMAIVGPVFFSETLRQDPFLPYSYFCLKSFISLSMGSLLLILIPAAAPDAPRYVISKSMALIALTFIAYWLGYRSIIGKRLASIVPLFVFEPAKKSQFDMWRSALILYGLGWAGRIGGAALGLSHLPSDLSGKWQIISIISQLRGFASLAFVVILWVIFTRKNHASWMPPPGAIAFTLIEIFGGMLDGGRSQIIMPLIYATVVYHYTKRHVSWKMLLVGFAILFLVLAPLTTIYRTLYYQSIGEVGQPGMDSVQDVFKAQRFAVAVGEFSYKNMLIRLSARFSKTFDGTIRVLDQVPREHQYQMGRAYFPDMFTAFIPRIIWSGKPVYLPGREFAKTFWGTEVDRKFGTSTGIGVAAELYYNFGWFGLLFAPLFGLIIRFFFERYQQYRRVEEGYLVRLFFILFIVLAHGEIVTYLPSLLRNALWYYLFLIILYRSFPTVRKIRNTLPVAARK